MKENIKKFIFFITGLSLIIVFSAFLIHKNIKKPRILTPIIKFEKDLHDFGNVKAGTTLEYVFNFENVGEELLIIKNVTTSCGCTGAMMGEKKDFQPGEKGKIRVTFNTEGRSGINEKNINVESNDPKNPLIALRISCNLTP